MSISCFQEDIDLVDIWHVKNPVSRSFTWSQNSPNIFCHPDYWLISNNLQDFVISTSIFPAIKTDHAAIFVEFGPRDNQMKGPGLWKMNCSILHDEDYIKDITLKIPSWIAEGERNLFGLFGTGSNITYVCTLCNIQNGVQKKKAN